MYLLTVHIPIYQAGSKCLVTTDWAHGLRLLRESLRDRFGPVQVLAPSIPADEAPAGQVIEDLTEPRDGIRLVPSFDGRCRARGYWLTERSRWRSDVTKAVAEASVVHAGLDDLYKPISFDGFRLAVRAGKPTVFVQDRDIVLRVGDLCRGTKFHEAVKGRAYSLLYEHYCRYAVSVAHLSLLKGEALMNRYGQFARNPKRFQNTSHSINDVVSERALTQRLDRQAARKSLRLVYCGRLCADKGVEDSLRILQKVRALGIDIEFDLIGEGCERASLERIVSELGLGEVVRFLGSRPYGPALLKQLSGYDALLFTTRAEDTPRMIFDGYAAGLPLLGGECAYVCERAQEEGATLLLPRGKPEAAASRIVEFARDPSRLATLSHKAREAGLYHTAERWYQRRAQWTFDAVRGQRHSVRVARV